MVLAYAHSHGLHAVITRCTNNYGPCQFPEKLIPLMIAQRARGQPLPVYGDGQQVRDWMYVERPLPGARLAALRRTGRRNLQHRRRIGPRNLEVAQRILRALEPDATCSSSSTTARRMTAATRSTAGS